MTLGTALSASLRRFPRDRAAAPSAAFILGPAFGRTRLSPISGAVWISLATVFERLVLTGGDV
jgi:hypothetical protein